MFVSAPTARPKPPLGVYESCLTSRSHIYNLISRPASFRMEYLLDLLIHTSQRAALCSLPLRNGYIAYLYEQV